MGPKEYAKHREFCCDLMLAHPSIRAPWRSLRLGERSLACILARHQPHVLSATAPRHDRLPPTEHRSAPGFLIHDSTIFDGVDERQRAEALELAISESHAHIRFSIRLNQGAWWPETAP